MNTNKFIISKHAKEQINLRNISEDLVLSILSNPDSIFIDSNGLMVIQKVVIEGNKPYLYRVFVNNEKQPPMVVTAYKTSKMFKYENKIR